ncbi:hypothetical protein OBBRIDRAFT_837179 [Obba rivulosa]|uniref:DNA polymerase lambda n=1 Tax=Obba rivulosa TaxID=1052685 RepID=A0A8E2DI21_9APHY|nr:hypothetical protein OBBRIDRAFT_837179 [Obba rivulosa]
MSNVRQNDYPSMISSQAVLMHERTARGKQLDYDALSSHPGGPLPEDGRNREAPESHDLPRLSHGSPDDKDSVAPASEPEITAAEETARGQTHSGNFQSSEQQAGGVAEEQGNIHRKATTGRESANRSSVATSVGSVPEIGRAVSSRVTVAAGEAGNAGKAKAVQPEPKAKGKKVKELVTPLEYAQRLQATLTEVGLKKKSSTHFYLRGKRIFYYGGDFKYAGAETRGRMDFIIKHGGTLIPSYDPTQITHIVTDAAKRPFLRTLGLRSLNEIPEDIPVVKWSWIVSGLGRAGRARCAQKKEQNPVEVPWVEGEDSIQDAQQEDGESWMDYEFMHASFSERIAPGPRPRPKTNIRHQEIGALASSRGLNHRHEGGPSNRQGSDDDCEDSGELSRISDFTQVEEPPQRAPTLDRNRQEPLSPPLSPEPSKLGGTCSSAHNVHSVSSNVPRLAYKSANGGRSEASGVSYEDPLAEFYAQARAERDATESCRGEISDDSSDDPGGKAGMLHDPSKQRNRKGGFLCDSKTSRPSDGCANEDVVDKLEQLMELHKAKPSTDDQWRVMSYGKAISALRQFPHRLTSYEQARTIRGVGDKTAQKIMEIIKTGDLRRLDYEKTEDVETITLFQGIYGVGHSTARMWYNRGCRTLQDLKEGKGGVRLTYVQRIGIQHYEDINSRMPRAEAAEIFEKVRVIAHSIDPKLFVEIMGSYRRGKADCGDIDILVTRPTDDGKTHRGVLRRLLSELHVQGVLTEDLCLPDDFNDLELVYRGLCRKDAHSARRRIDFLTVPYESRGAALLYYTGDDIFNRSMRLKANVMGYALNQRGLFAGVIRNPSDKRQKLNDGTLIASETEREIFDILGVPWQEPHERVRG